MTHHQPLVHQFTRFGTGVPINIVKTVLPMPGLHDVLRVVMQQHRGDMAVFDTHCPPMAPCTMNCGHACTASERFDVVFPDGYTIRQIRPRSGYSNLSFPLDSFPEDIRNHYGEE